MLFAASPQPRRPKKVAGSQFRGLIVLVGLVLLSCSFLTAQNTPEQTPPPTEPKEASKVIGMEATGTVDLGYRWTAGFNGSEDLYRSLVNLGEGPRLLGTNLNFANPLGANKYLDRLQLNASAWGGDPYNTLRLCAEKTGVYQFSLDYRKVDYFNFIPSFANPSLSQGVLLGQHSFDSTRRTKDFELTLRPGATVSPFLAYSRNSGFGPGVTTFTADGNEFAINNQLRDSSDYYRGGLTFNLRKLNLVLEQGFLTFKDVRSVLILAAASVALFLLSIKPSTATTKYAKETARNVLTATPKFPRKATRIISSLSWERSLRKTATSCPRNRSGACRRM